MTAETNMKHTVKTALLLLLTLAVLAAGLAACGGESDSGQSGGGNDVGSLPEGMPEYLMELNDLENVLEYQGVLTREDLGLSLDLAPVYIHSIVQCLINMDLVESEQAGDIPVEKPFTMELLYRGNRDRIAFTPEGIAVNEKTFLPRHPQALQELYDDDYRRVFTAELLLLGGLMDFSAGQVEFVVLTEDENYSDGSSRVEVSDPAQVAAILDSLSGTVVRRFEADEDSGMFVKAGGNAYECTLLLKSGQEWSFLYGGQDIVRSGGEEEVVLALQLDYDGIFGLLGSGAPVPQLRTEIGGGPPEIYVREFEYGGQRKTMTHLVPVSAYYETYRVLSPGEDAACQLTFVQPTGEALTPDSLEAVLYREGEDDQLQEVGRPVVEDGRLPLLSDSGLYVATVRAAFGEEWVSYLFTYRVSHLPWYFSSIGYNNDEDDVTVTRDDRGVSIPGGQNRAYVDLITGLELVPAGEGGEGLAVQAPFTLTFHCQGEEDVFSFSEQGVTYNGQLFRAKNPSVLAEHYQPFTGDDLGEERLDHRLRGFLTKETARFVDQFPLDVDQVESFVAVQERPSEYSRYDLTDRLREEGSALLDSLVLGRPWQEKDYYFPRRFYTSFEITMRDGAVYQIGEQLLIDGEDSGWYTVCSDSPLAERWMEEAMEGEHFARETPIPGGYSVDDEGNITFS